MLRGKKILLGVSGSIAAYKSAFLTRLLTKAGAEVKVVMTPSSKDFITPLTLATLSKNPVLSDYFKSDTGEWNNHVELGLWADLFIIAPLTANTLSKMARGGCDNLLLATYLSARCEVMIAPAMDLDMYLHSATQNNLQILKESGALIVEPEEGELASGLEGKGRMAEPENIMRAINEHLKNRLRLVGKKALVTAGPTYEAIDPVRFIGNHSSGKMGFAIAEKLAAEGAEVHLITGPTKLSIHNSSIHRVDIVSAEELHKESTAIFDKVDIAVLSAAVADYAPIISEKQKIKKTSDKLSLNLEKTLDTAASLAEQKSDQYIVGFALETENETSNALSKLEKKKFDLIVLNSLNDPGAGFGHDTNKVTFIDSNGGKSSMDLKLKSEVAQDIVDKIVTDLNA